METSTFFSHTEFLDIKKQKGGANLKEQMEQDHDV